jgi:hypothetical protein
MENLFSIFAAIMGFATAVTILRRTGTAYTRSLPTAFLGFICMVVVHISPFIVLKWYLALGTIVLGQIAGGLAGNFLLLPYLRSTEWPDNASQIIRFVPIVCYVTSIAIATLVLVNLA